MKTTHNIMRRLCALCLLCALCVSAAAQITSVHGTVKDDLGELIGASVCEIDANGRIIEMTVTDFNGKFTMRIRNASHKLRVSYVGCKTVRLPINKTNYDIRLQSENIIDEVVVTATARGIGNNLAVPEREISYAKQTVDMTKFEGIAVNTIDEALQGQVAGLDIVASSGNLGSGSTMRLRGVSSISTLTGENPLIVVDGNIWNVDTSNFDLATSNDEKFAELLNINPEDIATITVLKDAAATAVYGSRGGNGVIEITTKRGRSGRTHISYSAKLTATYQPKGYDLLSGDDYTMLLKESYYNPRQDDAAADIRELNYDQTYSEYEQFNNNTDWVDAVKQWGLRQNHFVTLSGGGEKANFHISGGFDHETGAIIEQKLNRFSTRVNLDYNISQRIRVSTNFALTYTKNNRNSDNLLAIALVKMPNMSIYEQDPVTGANTDRYYTMLQPPISSAAFQYDQRGYVNPVASAHLAKNVSRTYNVSPELVVNYRLLGLTDDSWKLDWRGSVFMNVFNEYADRFYPSDLVTVPWANGVNTSYAGSSKSVSFNTKQTLTLVPHFTNKDHSLMAMGRFELNTGTSNGQSTSGKGTPSEGIEAPETGKTTGMSSYFGEWRSLGFSFSAHYAYKGRYMLDFSARADGTTKFGPGRRWGIFPGISGRWNIIDEPWMEPTRKWLSMLSVRPSWGRVGHQPNQDYLYTSKYGTSARYIDQTSMFPINMRLTDLQWENVTSYNLGTDLGFFDGRVNFTLELYRSTTDNMLMRNFRIPSNFGFVTVPYHNNGKMRNTGWEFHLNTRGLVKTGKFVMDMNLNFGNNRNEILEMDENVLNALNSNFNYNNREVLTRVELNSPFGAIYGFRSKGVYQYRYETFTNMTREEQDAFVAAGKTVPVAIDEQGHVIYDEEGKPMRMMFNYTNDASGRNYKFEGGDAIYEDTNHDGNIDALDIVYLGSSLPRLTGGFGFMFTYGSWRMNTSFVYRVGNKILNMARLDTEAMTGNNNQSQAVNYRWKKDGDETTIPRAMYGSSNYNTLVSDRFVEDGTYLRMGWLQLSYSLGKNALHKIGINKLSFYASANNLFVLTKYSGVDPDVGYGGYGAATDWGQTPRPRSYTFGINIDF